MRGAIVLLTLAVALPAGATVEATRPAPYLSFPGCGSVVKGFEPAWSPNGRRIAFTVDYSGSTSVWLANADGSGRRQLTSEADQGREPAWSPGSAQIAFRSVNGVETMRSDGTGRRLVISGWDPAWSPDGSQLVITTGDMNTTPKVGIVGIDGAGLKTIASGWAPVWSPDGRSLAFTGPIPGVWKAAEVDVVNVDGTGKRTLTTEGASPAWSPDGRKIAYVYADTDQPADLWLVRPDGAGLGRITHEPRITNNGNTVRPGTANDGDPTWSPDSRRIIFVRRPLSSTEGGGSLWVIDAAGRGEHPINPACRFGTSATDVIHGTRRGDRIYGLEGNDRISGGAGNDLIVGGPGRDTISCGSGRDVVYADGKDRVARDCERILRDGA